MQIEHGEKEIENGGGKERASNPTRSRRQNTARVSLFFINRLIGKDTSSLPPYLVLPFHPCFISSNSSSPFLRFLPALLSLPLSPFHRQIHPSLSSQLSVSLFRQLLPQFLHLVSRSKPPPPHPGDDEAEAFVTRFWSTSSFFLAILFNFFFRSGGNPFITRLQCLADNKPMKATFEPRGSFENSFFANLSPSLSFL